jgi:phosphopantothenoylcysteine decarboxylase/phosphopantothenate--cysteine ligase
MKRILLGITGSIAAYKTPDLVRKLLDADFDVKVVLTESAKSFVSPLVLQTLASPENVFEAFLEPTMQHIQLAKWADIILIILAPGMNQSMWLNTATAHNVETLKSRNIEFWGPDEGIQACGDMGPGRMLEPNEIIQRLLIQPNTKPLLSGKKILITAGPTQEPIDPVRFISNRSSGKMGYALAKEAMLMGADVTLISGPVSLKNPGCKQFIPVKTARDMAEAVELNLEGKDVFIAAAAVADYEVESVSSQKIKKTGQSLELLLKPTKDILLSLVAQSNKPYLIGFAAETENLIENAQGKLQRKNLDMMIANDVSRQDIGFDSSDNEVFILTNNSSELTQIKKSAKHEVARKILLKLAKELS